MISETFLSAFVYRLLTTVFYQALAYFPFRHRLRYSAGRVLFTAAAAQVFLSAAYACATTHGAPVTATMLFSVLGGFLVLLSNVRTDIRKILFLYIFVLDYVLLIQGLAYYTESLLFYSPQMTFGSTRTLVLILLYTALSGPLVLFFLQRAASRAFAISAPHFWNVAWMLPAFTTLIVLMYTSGGTAAQIRDIRFPAARVLLIFILFLVTDVLLRALHLVQEQSALSERSAQQSSLLAVQSTQYRQLIRHMEQVRQARHDLSQHLRVIQHYLDTDSKEALQEYLQRYAQTLPTDSGRIWCPNQPANTIVSYYAEEAKNAGIAFYGEVLLPERLPVAEPDLCSILGNLLENALFSAEGVPADGKPFIHIEAEAGREQLFLTIDNSCTKEPEMKDGQFLSSRHEGYGTGTKSVRTIAEKYGGEAIFRYEREVFSASVFLQIQITA